MESIQPFATVFSHGLQTMGLMILSILWALAQTEDMHKVSLQILNYFNKRSID